MCTPIILDANFLSAYNIDRPEVVDLTKDTYGTGDAPDWMWPLIRQ